MPHVADTIADFAQEMWGFLSTSELNGTRGLVMEMQLRAGKSVGIYTIPCRRIVLSVGWMSRRHLEAWSHEYGTSGGGLANRCLYHPVLLPGQPLQNNFRFAF